MAPATDAINPAGFAGSVPAELLSDEARQERATDTQQCRDNEAAGIISWHQHLCQNPDHQADHDHTYNFHRVIIMTQRSTVSCGERPSCRVVGYLPAGRFFWQSILRCGREAVGSGWNMILRWIYLLFRA
jgi:hypothetical protein